MTTPLPRPATTDGLFLWVLHRFAEVFEAKAVLKGGIELRLFDCPRSTTDIDYVFVPFRSKNEIRERIERVLREIDGAVVTIAVHSKMVRASLRVDRAAIQIEANVDLECPSQPMPTAEFARSQGQPSRLVRVMAPDCALAHKLAAWNERRLLRDLYDAYFLSVRVGATPDRAVLAARLAKIESRHPALRRKKKMSIAELAAALRAGVDAITEKGLAEELAPLLPPDEVVGLIPRIRSAVIKIAERLEAWESQC
jgi:predicted nucleotidyltransferase component of viral defense system